MKKALIITYYWPPAGGGGVQRVAKFARYLPRFNWEPVILTVAGGNFPVNDASLCRDVTPLSYVYRVPSREPHSIYHRLRGGDRKAPDSAPDARAGPSRIAEWIRLNLFIPDSRIGWRKPAVRKAEEVFSALNPEIIYSTAPPYTAHLVALALKNRYRVPWAADFRDPWMENFTYNTTPRLGPVRRLNSRLELRVLRGADAVVSVGGRLNNLLRRKLPVDQEEKFQVIFNGYDPADIPDRPEPPAPDFTLSYYGTIYRPGFPSSLFQALRELRTERPDLMLDLRVRLVGKTDPSIYRRFREVIPETQLSLEGYIPHSRMLEEIYRPQVLLLIINDVPRSELILTGKLFDYLPTGNPILAIGPPDGDAAEVIRAVDAGSVYSPDDAAGLKAGLEKAHQEWKAGKLRSERQLPELYSRVYQTGQLAALFNRLTGT